MRYCLDIVIRYLIKTMRECEKRYPSGNIANTWCTQHTAFLLQPVVYRWDHWIRYSLSVLSQSVFSSPLIHLLPPLTSYLLPPLSTYYFSVYRNQCSLDLLSACKALLFSCFLILLVKESICKYEKRKIQKYICTSCQMVSLDILPRAFKWWGRCFPLASYGSFPPLQYYEKGCFMRWVFSMAAAPDPYLGGKKTSAEL